VVYQNCQASGVPVGFTQLGKAIQTTVGGNPNLEPEDAETLTVGAVWMPTFVDDLTLTLDYFNIKIDNAIQGIPGSTKLAVCYNTPGLAHQFCSASNFTRNSLTGEIDYLSAQPVNAASERVSGIDIGALYQFDLAGMRASLSIDTSYLKNYDVRPFPSAEEIQYAGKITGGSGSYTQWRSFGSLTLEQGPWSGSYSIQYIGSADDINASRGDIGDHVSSLSYHNAQAKYSFNKSADIVFGIDNLWDKQAPFIQSYTDANTDTMTYDLLGRRWNAKFTYRW
jgi:outer membrane receptor protein involved in Fe transport